jgi:hypothetical protein
MNISSNSRRLMWMALVLAVPLEAAWSQIIPNPLVRPQRPSAAGTQPDPQARGATAAPAQGRASRAIEGEGLPDEGDRQKSSSEQLANLYVSAVIGDRAVLRSLEVRTVPPLGAGAAAGGGASGQRGEPGGASSGGVSGGGAMMGGGAGNIGGLRSVVYVVRNGEVLPFLDKLRLLVRVRDTTVTLFDVSDVPMGNFDPLDLVDRGFPVAFRGSIDSVQSLPPSPAGLIGPGQGLDGNAFERLRDTSGSQGSGSRSSTSNTNPSNSSSSGNDNNNP